MGQIGMDLSGGDDGGTGPISMELSGGGGGRMVVGGRAQQQRWWKDDDGSCWTSAAAMVEGWRWVTMTSGAAVVEGRRRAGVELGDTTNR
jgi:hypothetical protein